MTDLQAARRESHLGVAAAVFAFTAWGFFPIYFKALDAMPAPEILAWRITLSFVTLLAVMLVVPGPRRVIDQIRSLQRWWPVPVATLLIAVNWLAFIQAVTHGRVLESSLGYFLVPLANTALGMLFFGERPNRWKRVAVVVAGAGIVAAFLVAGTPPWLSLVMAATFALYGAVRKGVALDSATGLLLETALLTPVAVAWLLYIDSSAGALSHDATLWLALSGVITILPLLAVVVAARRIEMGTLGFFQYIAPIMHFGIAVGFHGETLGSARVIAFSTTLMAIGLWIVGAIAQSKSDRKVQAVTERVIP